MKQAIVLDKPEDLDPYLERFADKLKATLSEHCLRPYVFKTKAALDFLGGMSEPTFKKIMKRQGIKPVPELGPEHYWRVSDLKSVVEAESLPSEGE